MVVVVRESMRVRRPLSPRCEGQSELIVVNAVTNTVANTVANALALGRTPGQSRAIKGYQRTFSLISRTSSKSADRLKV